MVEQQFCNALRSASRTGVSTVPNGWSVMLLVNAPSPVRSNNGADSPLAKLKLAHLLPHTRRKAMRE